MRATVCLGLLAALCAAIALQFPAQAQEATTANTDLTTTIDAGIEAVWKRDKIKPADKSSDEEFLRRVHMDTVGEPPTYDEATAFLANPDRSALIDALVNDPRFGQHMADQWTVLLTPRRADQLSGAHLFADWMNREINKGTGFDTIIREIVLAEGDLVDKPTIVPWFNQGDAVPFTDMIGKLLKNLHGVQIQCAECHDHPYDEAITQKSFQGMAAFLTATQATINNDTLPQRPTVRTNTDAPRKVLKAFANYEKLTPEQKAQVDLYIKYVKPVTMDGTAIDTRDPGVWRNKLVTWMLGDEQTSRYVANRIWSIAFGSGLYNPVDDFTPLSEASHPELLEAIAKDFRDNGWDVRRLYRAILKSRAYQLGSQQTKAERWHFASYPVRALNAEQFIATLLGLLEPNQLDKIVKENREAVLEKAIADLKAAEEAQSSSKDKNRQYYEYDIATMNRYAEQFKQMDGRWYIARWAAGRYASLSQDDEMTSGEDFTMSINQALAVMNGEFTNAMAASGKDSLLERISKRFGSYNERMDALYLTVLSRHPTKAESIRIAAYLKEAKSPTQAAEDLLYALLMSTEFATNH
jgi:hypothetical protein